MRNQTTDNKYAGFYKVIAPLIMCSGVGDGLTTACVMAQAATIDALRQGKTLDKPTDEMECSCPVLRRLAIRANDTEWWESNEAANLPLRVSEIVPRGSGDCHLTHRNENSD